MLRRELHDGAGPEIEGLVPSAELDTGRAEDEGQRSNLQERNGEIAGEAAIGGDDKDEHVARSDEAGKVVGPAAFLHVFGGDFRGLDGFGTKQDQEVVHVNCVLANLLSESSP